MASPKTLALRGAPAQTVRVYVCADCQKRGGTLQRSQEDGLLYHPEHLPERRADSDG